MTDLIRRDDAIRELSGVCSTWEDDAKVQEIIMAIPSAKQTGDLIRRADAIEAICVNDCGGCRPNECGAYLDKSCDAVKALSALPSADAVKYESTVTLNSPISISAEAVQGWIPFTRRPMTEEEQKDYPNCTFIFDCVLPDDGDEILVSNRRFVWMDTFCSDIDGCYLDGGDDIDEDMAWMPLPTPYKGGDTE